MPAGAVVETPTKSQLRIARAVVAIVRIFGTGAVVAVVLILLDWITPALYDGPATVAVTSLGSMGAFAGAGVALWAAQQARDDARPAARRAEAARTDPNNARNNCEEHSRHGRIPCGTTRFDRRSISLALVP